MFWKVIFFIYTLTYLYFAGRMSFDEITIKTASDWLMATIGILSNVAFAFACTYLYSLGWKKQIIKKSSGKFILSLFILSIIASFVYAILNDISYFTSGEFAMRLNLPEINYDFEYAIFLVCLAGGVIFQNIVFWFFPFIAYSDYQKKADSFKAVEKPYWKIFVTYFAVLNILNYILLPIIKFDSFLNFSLFDYCNIAFDIISMPIIICFAYNKKFLPQIVWKILAIPCITFTIIDPLFLSDAYREVTHSFHCAPCMSFNWVLAVFSIIAICEYAYTNNVYKTEKVTETNIESSL